MKKVLIITYYWPPAGGISVHRCLKFAKYLIKFGWEPVIYTAENAQYPYFDESNLKDVPEGITIIKRPIIEPFNFFKKLSGRKTEDSLNNIVHVRDRQRSQIDELGIWIRGNFFIPDARALWIKPSVKFLTRYLKTHPVDAILSDGPPHTNTAIACMLRKKTGIPFLADFQDPWTQVDYYKLMKLTSWADRKHRKMEQEVFQYANKITIASPTWKKDLEQIGARNVDVIYWGYDEDDFTGLNPKQDQDFTITHAGLLGYDRMPESFFKVLSNLSKDLPLLKEKLKIQLAGQIDFSVEESMKHHGLSSNFVNVGTVARDQALKLIARSHVLLLLLNKADNAHGRIPGKFFEYLRARKPILCLGPENSDVAHIIKETKSGFATTYDDVSGIASYLKKLFSNYLENKSNKPQGDITPYSVENQTQKVSEFLNKMHLLYKK